MVTHSCLRSALGMEMIVWQHPTDSGMLDAHAILGQNNAACSTNTVCEHFIQSGLSNGELRCNRRAIQSGLQLLERLVIRSPIFVLSRRTKKH